MCFNNLIILNYENPKITCKQSIKIKKKLNFVIVISKPIIFEKIFISFYNTLPHASPKAKIPPVLVPANQSKQ